MTGKKDVLENAAPSGEKESGKADVEKNAETRFTKEQLLSSERFRERRDIVDALLKTGELYTVRAVEQMIEKYMKGKVK